MIEAALNILKDFWWVLAEMSPYLLFGFFVAGLLSVAVSPELIERHLGGRFASVIKAALFGVPLPLCSCGVIPVAASLRRHGASPAATTAFLISTPQTGVDSIFVTFSLLGGTIAIFRPVAALLSGLIGGGLVMLAEPNGQGQEHHKDQPCREACCQGGRASRLRRMFTYGFADLPMDIGPTLLVGVALAALISALVPEGFFTPDGPLGGLMHGGLFAMLVMMLLGMPIYVCATASVPLAWALIAKGVSPGAALVFLMTGPATNAATIATVWRVMGRRTTVVYLASVAATALGSGLLLDFIFQVGNISAPGPVGWMLPPALKVAAAGILLGVLAVAMVRRSLAGRKVTGSARSGQTAELSIRGMTCTHCAQSVRRALLASPGATSAEVSLSAGRAVVSGEGLNIAALSQAVEEAGYNVAAAELSHPDGDDQDI